MNNSMDVRANDKGRAVWVAGLQIDLRQAWRSRGGKRYVLYLSLNSLRCHLGGPRYKATVYVSLSSHLITTYKSTLNCRCWLMIKSITFKHLFLNMLFTTKQTICLAAQHRLSAVPRSTVRFTSRSTDQIGRFVQPIVCRKNPFSKDRKIGFAVGGASVATIGFLWAGPNESNYPDDPQDVKALSTASWGKLVSGWM